MLAVNRRWVEQGNDSYWSLCIDYLESAQGKGPKSNDAGGQRAKIDYKAILSPEDFAVFAQLRDLRKEVAQAEAVPVYTIFTNEQLAQIVQKKAHNKADLEQIAGLGNARIAKYGERLLQLLNGLSREGGSSEPVAGGRP